MEHALDAAADADARTDGYSMLVSSINHPDQLHQLWGLFNRRSLEALSRSGVDVATVTPRPYAPPIGPFSEYGSIPKRDETFPYPVYHPRFVYYLPKSLLYHRTGDSVASTLASWLSNAEFDPEVLHGCHLYPDGYALTELDRADETPTTAYAHGTIVNRFDEHNDETQARIEAALRRTDGVFCSGRKIRERILEIVPEAETDVVPIGADPSRFPTDRRTELREELGIPQDATVVLFCGKFTENKGVPDLLNVLPSVDPDETYVLFVGHGGDLRADVGRALSSARTPPGDLYWELHPIAVRRLFAVADALVLPSYSEGRPTVIYEAMASRTPVIATSVGGVPEQVADGETGWLIEPGDRTALRRHLNGLPERDLAEMGAAAEERLVERGWTWDAHADRIVEAHRRLR